MNISLKQLPRIFPLNIQNKNDENVSEQCETGTYKNTDMTTCSACTDGHQPNADQSACGKSNRAYIIGYSQYQHFDSGNSCD